MKKILGVAWFLIYLSIIPKESNGQNLVQGAKLRDYISLNGSWDVIADPLETGLYRHNMKPREVGYFSDLKMKNSYDLIEYDFDKAEQLAVPGDWNTQNDKFYYYEGTIWYRRLFNHQSDTDKKVFLRFEAVNYQCKVYLNGEHLGDHVGGYTPFDFDVTGKLKENNTLILKVDNKRLGEGVPTLNTDWWNYGGITRDVSLVEVPKTYISDYMLTLADDKKSVEGWVKLNGSDNANQTVEVSIRNLKSVKVTTDKNGKGSFSINAIPALWSPTTPMLYQVDIKSTKDEVSDEIGFKSIETRGTEIFLNGEPIFLKGISIHEQAAFGLGRVTSKAQCITLLNWAKEMGCNFIRLAHYPHNEDMVREAEKMGFMMWSEIPVYWTVAYHNPDTYVNAESQLVDMINRDKNRAGIVMWSVANETPISDDRQLFLKNLIIKAREVDETRLMSAALNTQSRRGGVRLIDDPLGEYIDVIGINSYCGWYSRRGDGESCRSMTWENKYDKPMIMSEMGAGALAGLHGEKDEIWTEEFQDNVYKCNFEMLDNIEFLAGMSPWILMDFRSPRRNLKRIQNDYNRKGLISENGQKKMAFFTLKEWYESK